MKTFLKFISESTAVQQAKRMGLVGDGHGGWYDKKGEFVAKTDKEKNLSQQTSSQPQAEKPIEMKPPQV